MRGAHARPRAAEASEIRRLRPVRLIHNKRSYPMKKFAIAAVAVTFLMSGGAAFAQASGAMSNDSMSHDSMSKDSMSKDGMSKDHMKKDTMKHDKMKKGDAMGMKHEASGAMSN
jgi:pentapeptide MXKDX repeat protein